MRADKANAAPADAADVREVLGTRFPDGPQLSGSVDGQPVTFDDIPQDLLRESFVDVPDVGRAKI